MNKIFIGSLLIGLSGCAAFQKDAGYITAGCEVLLIATDPALEPLCAKLDEEAVAIEQLEVENNATDTSSSTDSKTDHTVVKVKKPVNIDQLYQKVKLIQSQKKDAGK